MSPRSARISSRARASSMSKRVRSAADGGADPLDARAGAGPGPFVVWAAPVDARSEAVCPAEEGRFTAAPQVQGSGANLAAPPRRSTYPRLVRGAKRQGRHWCGRGVRLARLGSVRAGSRSHVGYLRAWRWGRFPPADALAAFCCGRRTGRDGAARFRGGHVIDVLDGL